MDQPVSSPAAGNGAMLLLRRLVLGGALRLGRAVLRRPRLKLLARRVLMLFPGLRLRVQTMMFRSAMSAQARLSNRVQDDADLSPRTVRMLRALKHAERRRAP